MASSFLEERLSLPFGVVDVHWRRHARARSLSLRADIRRGAFVVTLPPGVSVAQGRRFVEEHQDWMAAQRHRIEPAPPLEAGAFIPLHGVHHRICHRPEARRGVWLEDSLICVSGEARFLLRRLSDFIKEHARAELGALAYTLGAEFNLIPRRVSFKDTRTRWGSCSRDGAIMLSWRLVMTPRPVQHYVVAHELAHLVHMNHSAEFWQLVSRLTPHQPMATAWLKKSAFDILRISFK